MRALPDARFVELAGSGHVTYARAARRVRQAVAAFATEVTNRQHSEYTSI
jgi:hypothetical protein